MENAFMALVSSGDASSPVNAAKSTCAGLFSGKTAISGAFAMLLEELGLSLENPPPQEQLEEGSAESIELRLSTNNNGFDLQQLLTALDLAGVQAEVEGQDLGESDDSQLTSEENSTEFASLKVKLSDTDGESGELIHLTVSLEDGSDLAFAAKPEEEVQSGSPPAREVAPQQEQQDYRQAARTTEAVQAPDAVRAPEVARTPEAVSTPEVARTPEAVSTPEVARTPDAVSTPRESQASEEPLPMMPTEVVGESEAVPGLQEAGKDGAQTQTEGVREKLNQGREDHGEKQPIKENRQQTAPLQSAGSKQEPPTAEILQQPSTPTPQTGQAVQKPQEPSQIQSVQGRPAEMIDRQGDPILHQQAVEVSVKELNVDKEPKGALPSQKPMVPENQNRPFTNTAEGPESPTISDKPERPASAPGTIYLGRRSDLIILDERKNGADISKDGTKNLPEVEKAEVIDFGSRMAGPDRLRASTTSMNQPQSEIVRGKFPEVIENQVIKFSGTGGEGETKVVQVRLYPKELGEVRVELKMVDGRVSAQITAEQGVTRELLNSNLQQLRVVLQSQGVNVGELLVSQGGISQFSREGLGDRRSSHLPGGRKESRFGEHDDEQDLAIHALPRAARVFGFSGSGGLDLRM